MRSGQPAVWRIDTYRDTREAQVIAELSGSETVEKMLISQIVNTLIKSFDEIQAVSFTVDGDEAETLMGHVDITRSFSVPIL